MFTRTLLLSLCLIGVTAASPQAQSSVLELNDAGWQMIERGDGARAARLFADALELRPSSAVLLFGAGAAAHLRGQPKEARARLQRAIEIDPRLTAASHLLGQIAYDEGDVAFAIATYEKALQHAPDDQRLTDALAMWRADAEVHQRFEERRYDRFRVNFQGRADEALAARATEILNAAFWRIGAVLGEYPANAVVVMLYTEQQFRDITRAPEWAGGVYDGRIRVPAAGARHSPEAFERVLVHELAHAMIASIAPRGVPAWLHEGLAQSFEGDDVEAARRRLRASGRRIRLADLEEGFGRFSAADATVAYDESLLAADTMLKRPGFVWGRLFTALAESNRTEYTFGSFGLRYADVEAGF